MASVAGPWRVIDLEDDLGESLKPPVNERLLCRLSDMLELVLWDEIEAEEEIERSARNEMPPVNEPLRTVFFFWFSAVFKSEELVCERKKVATLCGILRKLGSRREPRLAE